VPVTVYYYVKEELEETMRRANVKLIVNQPQQQHNKNKSKYKKNFIELAIEAKQQESLRDSIKQLQALVKGVHVQCNERQFRYFTTPVGREFVAQLASNNTCDINVEMRLRAIVIFGGRPARERLRRTIEAKKAEVDVEEDQMFERFDDKPSGFIKRLIKQYGVDLKTMYTETGASYISINFLRHVIEFHGDKDSLIACKAVTKKVVEEMTSLVGGSSKKKDDSGGKECPVCFDELETTSHQLEVCCHSYCKECFRGMCQHAVQNKGFPMNCAKDGCDEIVSIQDIIEFVELKDIVPIAVEQLVATHKDEYKYCITPDCRNIYRVSKHPDPDPYACAVCQVQICAFCNKEFHAGLNCRFESRRDDQNLDEWLKGNPKDRGLCPSCSAPIEKIAGCMHITCSSCKKHVCWRCKKAVFENSNDCYNHMARCGGIF